MRLFDHPRKSRHGGEALLLGAVLGLSGMPAAAQQAPAGAPQRPANLQQTPPIAPKVQETPVPPPVLLPAPSGQPADIPRRPLTANEAVRIALRYQPNVTAARASIAAAQGRTQQIRAGLVPTVSINAGYTNVQVLSTEGRSAALGTSGTGASTGGGAGGTGTGGTGTSGGAGTGSGGTGSGGSGAGGSGTGSGGTGTSGGATGGTTTTVPTQASGGSTSLVASGFQASANLRQLIFDFNHTRDLVRQSSLQERAAIENLARVESDLVFQVKQAFYLYVDNLRLIGVSEENLANRQAQLALARARLNSGLGLPSDVAAAETFVAEAETNLVTARNNASLARINLALLMGIDPRTPIDAADSAEPPLTTDDVQGLVNTALRQRPEMLQAAALLQSARYGVSAARTTSAPSLAANLGLLSRGSDFPPGNNDFSIGVSVQWNAFDGGLTAGRVKEARANVDTAQAQIASTQLSVVSDVSQAYVNLRSAEQRVVTATTEVANAAEGLRIAQGRFASGLGLFLDIINAQASLVTARTNLSNAQFSVDEARVAVARAIGAPLPPPR